MKLPSHLEPALTILRLSYPDGLPKADYLPLLVVLGRSFSDENLALLVAELIDGETVVVENDAAAAAGYRRPTRSEVDRVRDHLMAKGYREE